MSFHIRMRKNQGAATMVIFEDGKYVTQCRLGRTYTYGFVYGTVHGMNMGYFSREYGIDRIRNHAKACRNATLRRKKP